MLYFVGGTALFSLKLGALLLRPYTKGMDIFDLFWFRSKWPHLKPNLTLLNNAIHQKEASTGLLDEQSWLIAVRRRLDSLDWKSVVADIRPFLESEDDLIAFTQDALLRLYS